MGKMQFSQAIQQFITPFWSFSACRRIDPSTGNAVFFGTIQDMGSIAIRLRKLKQPPGIMSWVKLIEQPSLTAFRKQACR